MIFGNPYYTHHTTIASEERNFVLVTLVLKNSVRDALKKTRTKLRSSEAIVVWCVSHGLPKIIFEQ